MLRVIVLSLSVNLSFTCLGQTPDTTHYYQHAFEELHQMIRGDIPTSFKRAVFITENAFLDGQLSYGDYQQKIDGLVHLCKAVAAADGLNYDRTDRHHVLIASSIYRVMKDSLFAIDASGKQRVVKHPYTYDMEDFWGEQNWAKMFVTKLLYAQSGNCHSLPVLYKILADELNAKAYLSLAPNHTYIKQWCDKLGWYNTELTTGNFPIDAAIKWNSYIKSESIAAGVYMDTLSSRENIAYIITDLAQGYLKKYGYDNTDLPEKWIDIALQYFPDYINALILKSELQKKRIETIMKERALSDFHKLLGDTIQKRKFTALEQLYLYIYQLGYRKMPKEMYLNWLFRIQKDTTRTLHKFSTPQPFKKYNYKVQTMTAGDGENFEFFDQDTVVQIGTVEINILSGKIMKFVQYDTEEIPDEVISRMYDPAIGRFWQIDPLAEKFYPASPYNYALNNPVNLIDPDGRSAEPIIDEKNKTITVNMVFVFYGSGATTDNVDAAIATINKMWNANADKEGWSDAGEGWRIQFNATGVITNEEGAQELAQENEGNSLFNYVRVENENEKVGTQDPVTGIIDHKVSHMQGGNSGFWVTRDMQDTTPAHETGHSLGFDPWHTYAEGIMTAGTDNRKVTNSNLADLRSYILQNGVSKSSLIDKYLFGVDRRNLGPTQGTIYNADGSAKKNN